MRGDNLPISLDSRSQQPPLIRVPINFNHVIQANASIYFRATVWGRFTWTTISWQRSYPNNCAPPSWEISGIRVNHGINAAKEDWSIRSNRSR